MSPLQEEILESNLPHYRMLAWKYAEQPALLLSFTKGFLSEATSLSQAV